MRSRTGISIIAILCCSLASPALAAPLQPTGKWGVDYGATRCAAARSFGSAASPVTLGIVPSVSGGTYALLVSEAEVGPRFAQESAGTIDFGTGPIASGALYFGGNGVKMRVHQFRIPAAQMEYARAAQSVTLKSDGASFEFALSDMGSLLDTLRACTADLQKTWNVGAATGKEVKPIGDVRAIFTTNDLPREAMERQQPDRAQYQVLVDEKGAVAGCDVLVPSGSVLVDTEGCQLVTERAKFKPAMDALGKAVRSVWTSPRVTWRTSQETLQSGCSSVGSSGGGVNLCGQSPTSTMLDKGAYGSGVPGRTPPQ